MRTVNGSDEPEDGRNRNVLLREFIDQVYLPFQRGNWKKSTQGTSENRIMQLQTVTAWRRVGFRLYWRWRSRKQRRSPRDFPATAAFAVMAEENLNWSLPMPTARPARRSVAPEIFLSHTSPW
jgi:hypothetical protein